jgi:hypothetical protein
MALSPSQIGSVLSELGIGFAIEYLDKATDPLKKTEAQVARTKKGISELGDETDKASKKLENMAKAHQTLATSAEKLLAVGGGFAALSYAVRNTLVGSIKDASEVNDILVGAQLRLQDSSQKMHDALLQTAGMISRHYNLPILSASNAIDQLAGSFKNLAQIKAILPDFSILLESTAGRLSGEQNETLFSNAIRRFNPDVNLQTASTSTVQQLGHRALGMLLTAHQIGKQSWEGMDFSFNGAASSIPNFRSAGVKDWQSQLMAGITMMNQIYPNNPQNAGFMAGQLGSALSYNSMVELGSKLGVHFRPSDGVPGLVRALRANPTVVRTLNGQMGMSNLSEVVKTALGGQDRSQALQMLVRKGGLEQYEYDIRQYQKDPSKTIAEYRDTNKDRFGYQISQLKNTIESIRVEDFGSKFLDPLTKVLKVINPIVSAFGDMLDKNPKLVSFVANLAGWATIVLSAGASVKLLGVAMEGLNMWTGLTMGRLFLLTGVFSGLSIVVGALGVAYVKNFDGMKTAVDKWFHGIAGPLKNFQILAEAAFEIFNNATGNSTHLDASLWNDAKTQGLQGFIKNIATLSFNMKDLFHGISTGFQAGFKPFADSFAATFGEGGLTAGLDRRLGGVHGLLKALNMQDFKSAGETIGRVFGGIAGNIGGAFEVAIPIIKELFHLIKSMLELVNRDPWIATMVGQSIGGPIGTVLEASGQARLYGGAGNNVQRGIIALGAPQTPVGRIQKAVFAADMASQGGNWFQHIFNLGMGAFVGQGAISGLGSGAAAPTGSESPGMGSLAINAGVVYVNGAVAGGGGGAGESGASGGNPLMNGVHAVAHGLNTVWQVGLLGTLMGGFGMATGGLGNIVNGFGLFGGNAAGRWLKQTGGMARQAGGWLRAPVNAVMDTVVGRPARWIGNGLARSTGLPQAAEMIFGEGASAVIGGALIPVIAAGIAGVGLYKYKTDPNTQKFVDGWWTTMLTAINDGKPPDRTGSGGTVGGSPADHVQQALGQAGNFVTQAWDNSSKFVKNLFQHTPGKWNGAVDVGSNFDKKVLMAITGNESGGNYSVMNHGGSGAMGRYQFMPGTADSHVPAWFKQKYGSTWTARGRNAFLSNINGVQDIAAVDYLHELQRQAVHGGIPVDAYHLGKGWYSGGGHMADKYNADGGVYDGIVYPKSNIYGRNAQANFDALPANVEVHVHVDGKEVAHHVTKIVDKNKKVTHAHNSGRDMVSMSYNRPGAVA